MGHPPDGRSHESSKHIIHDIIRVLSLELSGRFYHRDGGYAFDTVFFSLADPKLNIFGHEDLP